MKRKKDVKVEKERVGGKANLNLNMFDCFSWQKWVV